MNAAAATKSRFNTIEGIALSAVLQGLPIFSSAAMLLKLAGSHAVGDFTGGVATFVASTSILFGLMAAFLVPHLPRWFQTNREPVFFEASLPVKDKVSAWLAQPKTQLQLLTSVLMMSVLTMLVAGRV